MKIISWLKFGLLVVFGLVTVYCYSLEILPESGGINLRVPVIVPADTGAKGRAVNFEKVDFVYDLKPHLQFTGKGEMEFFVRDNLRREEKVILRLTDKAGNGLVFKISAAAKGRIPMLEYVPVKGQSVQADLKTLINDKWQKVSLAWTEREAVLEIGDKKASVKLNEEFDPQKMQCLSWSVDEILLKAANGELSLGWENGYRAALNIKNNGGISVMLTGFGSMAISDDQSKRDYPAILLANSGDKAESVKFNFVLKSEINNIDQKWNDSVTVGAGKSLEYFIKFPAKLQNDIYHLEIKVNAAGIDQQHKKNFMFVQRRKEESGGSKFGLHNYYARDFGYWPDALPIDIAHRYLRWGYVEGPVWVKDYNDNYGLDPKLPATNWNWNQVLDWLVLAGQKPLISVQSVPLIDRHMDHPYKVKIKKRAWGITGGFPKLEKFARFMDEAAKRYKGKSFMWEVENEPNSAYMPENPEDYWKVCKVVYDSVKKYTPEAKVYVISGTSNFPKWMEKALDAGKNKGDFYDGISWHTYSREEPDNSGLQELLLEAKKLVKPGTPLFNTETGMITAKREVVDKPLSREYVAQMVRNGHPAFISSGAWPGAVMSEFDTSAGIVKNVTLNFLEGVEGYVFFGWSPSRSKVNGDWFKTDTTPAFQIFTATRSGEITPNLYSLAIAVCTAQFEPVDLSAAKKEIKYYGIRGGVFSKKNGGKMGVLWSPTKGATAIVASTAMELERINVFGKKEILKPAGKINGGLENLYSVELDINPVYLHARIGDINIIPSPVEKASSVATGEKKGNVEIYITNNSSTAISLSVVAPKMSGVSLTPENLQIEVLPNKHAKAVFTYELKDKVGGKSSYTLPFEIVQKNAGRFKCNVALILKPVTVIPLIADDVKLAELAGFKDKMHKNTLDTVERVIIGRPPKFASIQEDYFWGGKEELSADIYSAYNSKGLYLYLEVLDKFAKKPSNWPGINGSSVELFFDLRSQKKGFGKNLYSRGVYQILVEPALAKGDEPKIWSPQSTDIVEQGVEVDGALYEKGKYWLAIFVPWSMANNNGNPPAKFAFDAGVNGSFINKAARKTQMLLFGNGQNFKETSGFSLAVLGK